MRGCGGPPRGRQATAPSGPAGRRTANRRPRRAAALPPPSTTGPLQRAAAGLLPLLPQRHAAVRKVAAAGAASGGRRAAARPEQRSRSGCSCPFFPLPSGQQADEDKVWTGITWCTRDCTRRFVLMLLLFFFDLRSVCVAVPFVSVHRRHSRRTRLLLRPLGCSDDVRDQATLPVSSPFQAVAPLAAGLRQAGARSASAPPAFLARTSPPMFLKEDVVATPDLSATLAATCAVATPVLSVT